MTYKPEEAPQFIKEEKPSLESGGPIVDEPKPIPSKTEVASPPLLADTGDLLVNTLRKCLGSSFPSTR